MSSSRASIALSLSLLLPSAARAGDTFASVTAEAGNAGRVCLDASAAEKNRIPACHTAAMSVVPKRREGELPGPVRLAAYDKYMTALGDIAVRTQDYAGTAIGEYAAVYVSRMVYFPGMQKPQRTVVDLRNERNRLEEERNHEKKQAAMDQNREERHRLAQKMADRVVGGATKGVSFTPNEASSVAQAVEEEVKENPKDPGKRVDAAGMRLLGGDPKRAQEHADEALKLDPNQALAWSIRAGARYARGDMAGAAADAKQALKLDPSDETAAMIVGNRDQLERAGSRLNRTKLDFGAAPDVDDTQSQPGRERAEPRPAATPGSDPQRSVVAALYTPPPMPLAALRFYEAAIQKLRVGDKTGALMDATRAVDAAPGSAAALLLRARVSRELGNDKGAVEDATRALALEPGDANALRERALAFLHLGRLEEALKDLDDAIAREPGAGVSYLYRAMVYEKLGRVSEALADASKSALLDAALAPLAADITARLRGPQRAPEEPIPGGARPLLRAAAAGLAMLLLILGLAGTTAGRDFVTTTAKKALGSGPTELEPPSVEVGPGTVLAGLYRVEGELGRGGMGVVYSAYDTALQRKVAIKRLQRAGEEDLERFLAEARTVAKLRHPRLAEIYNVLSEGDLFLVFEHVDGEPLDRALKARVRFPLAEARRMLGDVAAAVGFAHDQRVIHRDLKPSNVMLEPTGACKVMDFGIAHQASSATGLTRTSASGTPPYMAPEQAMGSVSKASDLFALGVMTYELLLGRRPFQGPDFLEQKLGRVFAAPTSLDPSLPKGLDAFFAQVLDPDPTKRPGSAAAFLAALDRAAAS